MTDAKMGDECKERVVRLSSFLKKCSAVVITQIKQVYFTKSQFILFITWSHVHAHYFALSEYRSQTINQYMYQVQECTSTAVLSTTKLLWHSGTIDPMININHSSTFGTASHKHITSLSNSTPSMGRPPQTFLNETCFFLCLQFYSIHVVTSKSKTIAVCVWN